MNKLESIWDGRPRPAGDDAVAPTLTPRVAPQAPVAPLIELRKLRREFPAGEETIKSGSDSLTNLVETVLQKLLRMVSGN